MKMIQVSEDALDSLKRMLEELDRDAARWRKARDFLSIDDIENWETEMKGHHPEEEESAKADAAIDRFMSRG